MISAELRQRAKLSEGEEIIPKIPGAEEIEEFKKREEEINELDQLIKDASKSLHYPEVAKSRQELIIKRDGLIEEQENAHNSKKQSVPEVKKPDA